MTPCTGRCSLHVPLVGWCSLHAQFCAGGVTRPACNRAPRAARRSARRMRSAPPFPVRCQERPAGITWLRAAACVRSALSSAGSSGAAPNQRRINQPTTGSTNHRRINQPTTAGSTTAGSTSAGSISAVPLPPSARGGALLGCLALHGICRFALPVAWMAQPPPDPHFVLRGAGAAVHALHFSCGGEEPDIPILFSGSENGFIHVWNLKTHRVDTALDGHGRKSVYWLKTMDGRDRLLSQGRDQRICLWDLAEGRTSVTDSVYTESVGFCRCSLLKVAQGRWLVAMAAKALEEVQVLELPSKTSVCTLKPEVGAKLGMPMCLKLWQGSCGSQPSLLAGYEDGSVLLWNLSTGKVLSQIICHQEPVMSLDFDSEKAKGISGSSEKVLSIWSLNEQQNLQVQKTHRLVNAGISDITIRPDKKILATAGWDHRIRIFGWKKMKPLAVLDYHTATVHSVSFSDHKSPSDRLLAAGAKDHRISVWSIYTQT